MKKIQRVRIDGSCPLAPASLVHTFLHSKEITSLSSLAMRPGISPVASILLIASRKLSDLISASVKMNVTYLPAGPASR